MKFVSKSSNLLIVLQPGMPAQPLTGTPAKATVSVRFKDGLADVQSEELVRLMLAHPGFGGDFISAGEVFVDPYAATRQSSEPAHILTELKHGTPMSRVVKGGNSALPPELQKIVDAMALEQAKKLLPSMVEGTLKSILNAHNTDKGGAAVTGKIKKKPGRKAKTKITENVVQGVPTTEPVNQASGALDATSNPAVQEQVS